MLGAPSRICAHLQIPVRVVRFRDVQLKFNISFRIEGICTRRPPQPCQATARQHFRKLVMPERCRLPLFPQIDCYLRLALLLVRSTTSRQIQLQQVCNAASSHYKKVKGFMEPLLMCFLCFLGLPISIFHSWGTLAMHNMRWCFAVYPCIQASSSVAAGVGEPAKPALSPCCGASGACFESFQSESFLT